MLDPSTIRIWQTLLGACVFRDHTGHRNPDRKRGMNRVAPREPVQAHAGDDLRLKWWGARVCRDCSGEEDGTLRDLRKNGAPNAGRKTSFGVVGAIINVNL